MGRKSIAVSLLVFLLCLCLTGCGNESVTSVTSAEDTPSATPEATIVPETDIIEESVAVPGWIEPHGGIYEGIESLTVEINSDNEIHFTLDGSMPDETSPVYTGPFELTSTTVVRAITVSEDGLFSNVLTESFIINEGGTLPVISLVTNDFDSFSHMYSGNRKDDEVPGNIALYDGEKEKFNASCGISLSGRTSLQFFNKKSLNIDFIGAYGGGKLKFDVFDSGVKKYSSLNLRAGQGSESRMFNEVLWQDLAVDEFPSVPTQHSKFCTLYLNGEYYGIYILKENISKSYYAGWSHVSKNSVEDCPPPNNSPASFYEDVFLFISRNDMRLEENYRHIEELLDIDNFIDYLIIQGVSANTDLLKNVRLFRSDENGNKWQYVLFDVDGAMNHDVAWNCVTASSYHCLPNDVVTIPFKKMMQNEEFRDKFLTRYAEVFDTVLSNDSLLERVNHYEQLLAGDAQRDRERWPVYGGYQYWQRRVNDIKALITDYDWQNHALDRFCTLLSVSAEEREEYFGS